jgi:hypothetical protein
MAMQDQVNATPAPKRVPWNKGKLTGAKPPLRPKRVWSIRTKLRIEGRTRDLAKLMSEIPGQSGHVLPDLKPPVCAKERHRLEHDPSAQVAGIVN